MCLLLLAGYCTNFNKLKTPVQECGDQTQDAYSINGLTYVTNARINVNESLEVKHLCIKLAILLVRVTL